VASVLNGFGASCSPLTAHRLPLTAYFLAWSYRFPTSVQFTTFHQADT
jgi:hypothetical protein